MHTATNTLPYRAEIIEEKRLLQAGCASANRAMPRWACRPM